MEANQPDRPPLEYSPPLPLHAQQKFKKSIIVVVVVGLLIALSPGAYRRAKQLYWQRQCMNYEAPPKQIVFNAIGRNTVTSIKPQPWAKFLGSRSTGSTVYLHRRTADDGQEMLVVVEAFFP